MVDSNRMERSITTAPNPDPTDRTEIRIDQAVKNVLAQFETRFNGIEKAIGVSHDDLVRVPTEVQKAVISLRELMEQTIDSKTTKLDVIIQRHHAEANGAFASHEERFESIKSQFVSQAVATDKLGLADKTALAAALQTQKESAFATSENFIAVLTKMENNFTKLFEQQSSTLASIKQNSDEKINDIKGRLDRGEGRTSVSDPATVEALRSLNVTMASLSQSRDGGVGAETAKRTQLGLLVSIAIAASAVIALGFSVLNHNTSLITSSSDANTARQVQQNTEFLQRLEQRLNLPQK